MADNYDLLCKAAMGVALRAEDLAALKADGLVVEETKLALTGKGRDQLGAGDKARQTPVTVDEKTIDRMLREHPDLRSGMPVDRNTLMELSAYRNKHLVEVGTVATVYEWGDSPHERWLQPGHIARISKDVRKFLEDRETERRAAETRRAFAKRDDVAALLAPDAT